mmetsp:Transcript_30052/g.58973  ORF Transcript_30052/g.58973 Transcript_30052/m.58973 type:complete len:109 (-) Transcript_30052:485-811(-)
MVGGQAHRSCWRHMNHMPLTGSTILGNMQVAAYERCIIAPLPMPCHLPPDASVRHNSIGQRGYSELKPPKLWRRGGFSVCALLGEEIRVAAATTVVSCCWTRELDNSE